MRSRRASSGLSTEFRKVARSPTSVEGVDLVLHQRDERRDHQRRATQEPRGDLEGEGLAGARGHDAHDSRGPRAPRR